MVKLRTYQHAALEALRAEMRCGRRRVMLYGPTGCHAAGEHILMADGSSRAAEEVCAGDRLMGDDGVTRTVLGLRRGRDDMARIVPVKGAPFTVNLGHVLSLVHTESDEVTDVTVREWLTWSNYRKHVHKLFRCGVRRFDVPQVQLPIHPWLLGVLLGDGTLANSPIISNSHAGIQTRVVELSAATGVTAHVRNYGGGDSILLPRSTRSPNSRNPLGLSLTALGLRGATAHEKFVPCVYKTANESARRELLAGLLDTDGHFSNGHYDWISASERLADDVAFVARSLGLAAYKSATRKFCQSGAGGTYYRVSISGELSGLPTVKHRPPPRRQKKNVLRTGFAVELLPAANYYGWTVDGNGRYLMADFTVTHNSGKTEMGIALIKAARDKGTRVLFACNRIGLVEQASRRFLASGLDHGILQGGNSVGEWKPVVVASIQTVARRGAPSDVGLLVIDEAHGCAGSKEYRKLIAGANCPVVGLSATPFTKGLGRSYAELGGPLFESIAATVGIRDLIAEGWLVDCEIYAPSEPDLSAVRIVAGDYHEGELGDAVDKPALVGDIVSHWFKFSPWKATVCFATNIAHSRHIVEQFRNAGVAAEHIDCYTDDEERRTILQALSEGEIKVVSNVAVLAEGWDSPKVETMILARPTRSLARYIQMAGRVLRPFPGKAKALILDHSATCKELGFPTDDLPLVLDDGKTSASKRKAPERPLPKLCPACQYLKPAKTHRCPKCGFSPERQSVVDVGEGELAKLERRKREQITAEQKESFYAQLVWYGEKHGYNKGWAYHKLREWCGKYPHRDVKPVEATPETLSWIRSRNIRWAKSKQGKNRAAA